MPGVPLGRLNQTRKDEFSYKDETRDQTGWRAWIFRHRWLPIQTIETDLAWVAFIVFSAATLFSHNTAVLFPLATNIFVLGLMLFQRIKKIRRSTCLPGSLFLELGEGSDWNPPAMDSMDISLHQASQRSLSEVLDS